MKHILTWRQRLAALLALLGVAFAATACATRPASNQLVLYYAAGAGENNQFQECIQPGTSGSYPIDDQTFTILTDNRSWNIAANGGDSDKAIESGSKPGPDGQPGPTMKTWASADFVINRDCTKKADSPVVRFWQDLGLRYGISVDSDENGWQPSKWKDLLEATLVPAMQKAIREGTRFYLADDLDGNTHGERAELERRIAPLFQAELRAKLGGDYFCGIGYRTDAKGAPTEVDYDEPVQAGANPDGTLKFNMEHRKSTCPPVRISITDIDFANAQVAAARADVYAAQQRAKAALIQAQAELDKSELLGKAAQNPAYLKYKQVEAQLAAAEACKASPNCTVVIDGSGGGVNVNTR